MTNHLAKSIIQCADSREEVVAREVTNSSMDYMVKFKWRKDGEMGFGHEKTEFLWNVILGARENAEEGKPFQNEKALYKLDSGGVLFSSSPRNWSMVWFGDPSHNHHIYGWWHCIIHLNGSSLFVPSGCVVADHTVVVLFLVLVAISFGETSKQLVALVFGFCFNHAS